MIGDGSRPAKTAKRPGMVAKSKLWIEPANPARLGPPASAGPMDAGAIANHVEPAEAGGPYSARMIFA
jgi:hypothetical protein